jgi:hypothetical protein
MRRALIAMTAALVATACAGPTPTPSVTNVTADTVVAPSPSLELLLLTAAGDGPPPTAPVITPAGRRVAEPPLAQLPRGGRQIFPRFLVVAHYGTAGTGALGVLGEGTPAQAGPRLLRAAAPFARASGRRVLPAFELIASIAQRKPGDDGTYSTYIPDADVTRYLAEARKVKALVVLDLQPGRADFLTQARHFEKFLRLPDVGLALDPEWKLRPTQVPLRQIGATDAASINRVSSYLANLTVKNRLPQKLLVVHQFRGDMITDRHRVVPRPGLAMVVHLDGFGSQGVKRDVYGALSLKTGPLHNGLKLFIDEDTKMFTPAEAMAFRPRPELITYQ